MSVQEKIVAYVDGQPIPDPRECVAVPGSDSMIDCIHPVTNKTVCYGKTLDDVRAEKGYEKAERMTIEAFCEAKALRQHTPITWNEVTEEKYDEMFDVLPPIMIAGKGFLVSEPWDHDASNGAPRYAAYRQRGGKYYTASRPMTVNELKES